MPATPAGRSFNNSSTIPTPLSSTYGARPRRFTQHTRPGRSDESVVNGEAPSLPCRVEAMISTGAAAPLGWRSRLPGGVRPYVEAAPLAAAFLGVSSGFAYAMIGATLTTRLAQFGIRKSAVTAFLLTFLAYN